MKSKTKSKPALVGEPKSQRPKREKGLPDTRDSAFIERYRAQCAALAASARAKEEIEWWERLQTDEGWV